jgi:tetratricopeptide (TPR) repeat protein
MSQAELAGGRFSKEYVSQIEQGKTRPTRETLEWLAGRLATDREFLEKGVSRTDAERLDNALRNAERLVEGHRYEDALDALRETRQLVEAVAVPAFSLRLLTGEAWARIRVGDLDAALASLDEAAGLAATADFSDVDRADVTFRVGVCRYSESSISEATALFDEALTLAEGSGLPSDRLRSDILQWRSRCHRRERDWVAAREDIERALELAESLADSRRIADACFQASLVAQREGRWVLARTYAERSKALFEDLGDRATVGRLLNNLAGLNHLLGNPTRAISLLREAFAIFVDLGLAVDAGYVCSSLADVYLDGGDFEQAEAQARKALRLLGGRLDHLQEVGTAQLVLGRALAEQGELGEAEQLIATAERTFEQASSLSHRSDAWIAQGDLEVYRGDDREAAVLYRRAAQALLDTR